jgi:hypothetical protein
MGDSGRSSEGQNADRNVIKAVLMKFQMGTRTLLGIRQEAVHVTLM